MLSAVCSMAQEAADTLPARDPGSWYGANLMVRGLVLWGTEHDFRNTPHRFTEHSNTFADNYIGYTPLAATTILKAAGVPTRSSWGRYAVGVGFSGAIMVGVSQGLKHTVYEWRPDGVDDRSFPSGHTATAFMCAQIMSKELGWQSPWYTVGAYAVAMGTGISRIYKNRHWVNDVVFGAGVGITSVDLGYFLTDLIFKENGLNPEAVYSPSAITNRGNPSFFGIGLGNGTGGNLHLPAGLPVSKMRMGASTSVTAEGAWFWNDRFGIGARVRAIAAPIISETADPLLEVESAAMGILTFDAGAYASFPVGTKWRVGANALVGDRLTTSYTVDAYTPTGTVDKYLQIDANSAFNFSFGLSASWHVHKNTIARFAVDFERAAPHYIYNVSTENYKASRRTPVNAFTMSFSMATAF